MRTNKIYKRAQIILVLAFFSIDNGKGQNIAEVLLKSRKAYDTANVVTDSKATQYNTMSPDTISTYGKLYYLIERSDQHFLLETPNWHFIRNNRNFGYDDLRTMEFESFGPKSLPPFLTGWFENELLLPFQNDTAFFCGRFKAEENITVSMDKNDTHYILKKHRTNPTSEIEATYFINKKTFFIESTILSAVSTDGTGFKLNTKVWYKYSPVSKKVILHKIDNFVTNPEKPKWKD